MACHRNLKSSFYLAVPFHLEVRSFSLHQLIITFRIFYLSHTLFWPACEPSGLSGTIRIVPEYSLPVPSWYIIMVALADWYILPILLQLEKLSGSSTRPSCHWLDLVAVDEYAELEVQPIWLDLSIKYTGQILFDSIVLSFKTPGQW